MKFIFLLFIVAGPFTASAQSYLVPYHAKDKVGLSDEKGTIVLKPEYDDIRYLKEQYFRTENEILLKDTLETEPRNFYLRNEKVKMSGILKGSKVILKDEPYTKYEIIPGICILGQYEGRYSKFTKEQFKKFGKKDKFTGLHSLDGKNVYPDMFRRLQKVDTAGLDPKGRAKYILFVAEHFDNTFGIFVFDIEKQMISNWLVEKSGRIKINESNYTHKNIRLEFTDSQHERQAKRISYSSGKFEIDNDVQSSEAPRREPDVEISERSYSISDMNDAPVAVPRDGDPQKDRRELPPFQPHYQTSKDSVFYLKERDQKKHILLPAGAKMVFVDVKYQRQNQSLMYFKNGKFGIITEGKINEALYDSLVYFRDGFIAGKKDGSLKFGTIDKSGKIVVPLIYDSIRVKIKEMEIKSRWTGSVDITSILLSEVKDDSRFPNTNPYLIRGGDHFIAYKKGKAGLITVSNEMLLPFEYELIVQNGYQTSGSAESKFMIVKKNNKYGTAVPFHNRETNKTEIKDLLPAVFDHIPLYYMRDYYGQKGLKIYAMFDENGVFKGYANRSGKMFYD